MYATYLRGFFPVMLLGLLCGCHGASPRELPGKDYNVALILVDTLRPDHLGCYGYERPTSPFMDTLAAEGVLFENARTASTFTGEAVSALMTGRPPAMSETGLGWTARPTPMPENLPRLFEAAGYKTGIFSTSFVMRFKGFYDSFQESELFPGIPNRSDMDFQLTDAALDFAKRHRDVPSFQYLHYYAPHAPYQPPAQFLTPFSPDPSVLNPDVEVNPAGLVVDGMKADDPRLAELKKHYDAEIALIDQSIRRYVEGLKALGTLSRTIIVIVSDHGEEFMEHGFADHAWNLHDETLRIPMILWAPSLFSPSRVEEPVSLVDVMPTLLRCTQIAHAEFSQPETGHYLFQANSTGWEYTPRPATMYASLFPESRAQLHAVLFDHYKYIGGPRWLGAAECRQFWLLQTVMAAQARDANFHPMNPWSPPEHEAVFDLSTDPLEQRDLSETNPELLERGRELIDAYRRAAEPYTSSQTLFTDKDPFTPEYVKEHLKNLAVEAVSGEHNDGNGERIAPEVIEGLETMGYL